MVAPLYPPVIPSNIVDLDMSLADSEVGDLLAEIKRDMDMEMYQAIEWVEEEEAIAHVIVDQWAEEMSMVEAAILYTQENYMPSESDNQSMEY